jgi:hypothetical protein
MVAAPKIGKTQPGEYTHPHAEEARTLRWRFVSGSVNMRISISYSGFEDRATVYAP